MPKLHPKSKSPIMLSVIVGTLIVATLMMLSHYFLRPHLEVNLKQQIVKSLHKYPFLNAMVNVEGRDVILTGIVANKNIANLLETEIKNISGVHAVDSKLLIKNQTIEQ